MSAGEHPPAAPKDPQVWAAEARTALRNGQAAAARALLRQALRQAPRDPDLRLLAARAAALQADWARSRAHAEAAAQLAPDQALPQALLARACDALGDLAAAQAAAQAAVGLAPADVAGWTRLADLARRRGDTSTTRHALQRLLALAPDHLPGRLSLAALQWQGREVAAALGNYEQALALAPQEPGLAAAVLQCRQQLCDWRDWTGTDRHQPPTCPPDLSPLAALALPLGAAAQLALARAAGRSWPAHSELAFAENAHAAPLKVALLSGDLGNHAVGQLLAGVIEAMDPRRIELHALVWGPLDDRIGRRVQAALGKRLHRLDGLDDGSAAAQVRALAPVVLVDLGGHTAGSRLRLLARRLAPVQMSWLGFPGSTGAPAVDYLLADEVLLPAALRHGVSEQVLSLPVFQPNDPTRWRPASPAPSQTGEPVVLADFNRAVKITPPVFGCWLRILAAVPQAELWLLEDSPEQAERLRAAAGALAPRLRCWPRTSVQDYLARYEQVDLVLDTHPFSGGTTSSDALGAGVPIVTWQGDSLASRMTASLLRAAGETEGICDSLAEYEATAIRWASDRAGLAARRQRLGDAPARRALFDPVPFAGHLATAWCGAARRWRQGLPPAHGRVDGDQVLFETVMVGNLDE